MEKLMQMSASELLKGLGESEKTRTQGNEHFRSAFDPSNGRSPALRIRDARQAMSHFGNAQSQAKVPADWLKATKNLATTQVKLSSMPGFHQRETLDGVVRLYREGFVNLVACVVEGYKHDYDIEWIESLDTKISSVATNLTDYLIKQSDDWKVRCGQAEKILSDPRLELQPSRRLVALLWTFIAEEMIKEWVRADEANNWHAATYMMHEMHRPLTILESELARGSAPDRVDLSYKLEDMQLTFKMQRAKAECAQHTHMGIEMLCTVLYEEEDFDIASLFTGIDHLKAAVRAAHNEDDSSMDLEGEAKALALLGDVYLKALKLDEKARAVLLQAVQLAESVMQDTGKSFYQEEWYTTARTNLTELRKRQEEMDRQKEESDVAEIKEKLKPQLDAIVAAMAESEAKVFKTRNLLRHIYKHHPPKSQGAKFDEEKFDSDDKASVKKLIKEAVAHYHPDKVANKQHGQEWAVLCQEITKHLNSCFEWYK